MEWTSGNVLVAPLDDQDVVATLARSVDDRVLAGADVADGHLLARNARTHYSDQQHAVA